MDSVEFKGHSPISEVDDDGLHTPPGSAPIRHGKPPPPFSPDKFVKKGKKKANVAQPKPSSVKANKDDLHTPPGTPPIQKGGRPPAYSPAHSDDLCVKRRATSSSSSCGVHGQHPPPKAAACRPRPSCRESTKRFADDVDTGPNPKRSNSGAKPTVAPNLETRASSSNAATSCRATQITNSRSTGTRSSRSPVRCQSSMQVLHVQPQHDPPITRNPFTGQPSSQPPPQIPLESPPVYAQRAPPQIRYPRLRFTRRQQAANSADASVGSLSGCNDRIVRARLFDLLSQIVNSEVLQLSMWQSEGSTVDEQSLRRFFYRHLQRIAVNCLRASCDVVDSPVTAAHPDPQLLQQFRHHDALAQRYATGAERWTAPF